MNEEARIGVYVCHCGSNIAGTVDVENVAKWAAEKLGHRGVVIARDYKFMCSSLGQELIEKDIKELGLNAGNRRGLLPPSSRKNLPHRSRTRGSQSLPVRAGFHP